jgi:ribose transport system substrate-binding protein
MDGVAFNRAGNSKTTALTRLPGATLPAAAALLALLAVTGCKPKVGPPGDAVDRRPRVALVMKSLANDFFATMADGARRHQAQHAAEYDLLISGTKNETDLGEQVNLIEQAVAQRAAAIVIAPADSKALIPALRRAQRQGVVIVNIDNRLDAEAARQSGLAAAFVGPDNREGARRVGLAVAAKLDRGDEVAIIEGVTTAFNGRERRAGFEEAMQAAGMTVVAVQSGEWEMEKANTVAANLLVAHPRLKALLCANDDMAMGAAAAVAAAGRTGSVLIAGFDDIAALRPLLADGRVVVTADQHADRVAVAGIESALRSLKDGKVGEDEATAVDVVSR